MANVVMMHSVMCNDYFLSECGLEFVYGIQCEMSRAILTLHRSVCYSINCTVHENGVPPKSIFSKESDTHNCASLPKK